MLHDKKLFLSMTPPVEKLHSTQDFTKEGFTWWGTSHRVWGMEVPSGVWDQSPGRRSGGEAETKCEISVQFLMFPVEHLRFNEYRSRAWTLYFANTRFKKFWRFNGGFERPDLTVPRHPCPAHHHVNPVHCKILGTPMSLPMSLPDCLLKK